MNTLQAPLILPDGEGVEIEVKRQFATPEEVEQCHKDEAENAAPSPDEQKEDDLVSDGPAYLPTSEETPEQKAIRLRRELSEMTEPLVRWLRDNFNPHCSVRITHTRATVHEGRLACQFPYHEG